MEGLKRAGAEFWTVDVGPDGTVYALAYEPGTGGTSTATSTISAAESMAASRSRAFQVLPHT